MAGELSRRTEGPADLFNPIMSRKGAAEPMRMSGRTRKEFTIQLLLHHHKCHIEYNFECSGKAVGVGDVSVDNIEL